MNLFYQAINFQCTHLAEPMKWYGDGDVHDAWDDLIVATFDDIIRQPLVCAADGRGASELKILPFTFHMHPFDDYSWIGPTDDPTRFVVWGVHLEPNVEPKLKIYDRSTGKDGLRTWAPLDQFRFVRRWPSGGTVLAELVDEFVTDE